MKHMIRVIFDLTLLMLSGSSLAAKWTIGASLAVAKSDNEDEIFNSQLAARGLNATAHTEDTIRMPWQLYGGYDFSEQWGVELAYLDLDKVETTFTGTTVDIETFLNSTQDLHPSTAQGWLIS